jgi:hypothetical protein
MKTQSTKNTKSGKNTYILLAFSGLLVTALFGFNNHRTLVASHITSPASTILSMETPAAAPATRPMAATFDYTALVPVTPVEADFSDVAPENPFVDLTPVTPQEATFEDQPSVDADPVVNGLTPVTPEEADFNDTFTVQPAGIDLQPVIPSEATFEEII